MITPTTPTLTERQQRILAAIEAGHTTMRRIADAADISSTSVVRYNLLKLAEGDHILLRNTRRGLAIATGSDFCTAWDAVCRLAGNDEA
jgi:hypothetical protein